MGSPSLHNHKNLFVLSTPTSVIPQPYSTIRSNNKHSKFGRILLAFFSLGITELARFALKTYRTQYVDKNNYPRAQVKQAQITQYNLNIIERELDPNKNSIYPNARKHVLHKLKNFFTELVIPNFGLFVEEALYQLKDFAYNHKKFSEKIFTDLLFNKLKLLIVTYYIRQQLLLQNSTTFSKKYKEHIIPLIQKFSFEIHEIANGNSENLKEKLDTLIELMDVSFKNSFIQEKVITKCIDEGFNTICITLNITKKDALQIPRTPILTKLYHEAHSIEKKLYKKNNNHPIETPAKVYEGRLTKLANTYFKNVIHVGMLTTAITKNSQETIFFLSKALNIISNYTIPELITHLIKSSKNIEHATSIALTLFNVLSTERYAIFENKIWENLPSATKKLFMEIIYALLKVEYHSLTDTSIVELLNSIAKNLDKQGLQLTTKLSHAKTNDPILTELMDQSKKISGTLIMVLSLIGGKGYGLE